MSAFDTCVLKATKSFSILTNFIRASDTCAPTPGGVLGISSDGDDQRIFLCLKFLIPGFFWVRKFGKYFFG